MKAEASIVLFKNRDAQNVRWQQVASELHALKMQAQYLAQCQCECGFSNAGNVLDEQVPTCKQTGKGEFELLRLSQNDLVKARQRGLNRVAHMLLVVRHMLFQSLESTVTAASVVWPGPSNLMIAAQGALREHSPSKF